SPDSGSGSRNVIDGPDSRADLLIPDQQVRTIVAQPGAHTEIFEWRESVLHVPGDLASYLPVLKHERVLQIKCLCGLADLTSFRFLFVSDRECEKLSYADASKLRACLESVSLVKMRNARDESLPHMSAILCGHNRGRLLVAE